MFQTSMMTTKASIPTSSLIQEVLVRIFSIKSRKTSIWKPVKTSTQVYSFCVSPARYPSLHTYFVSATYADNGRIFPVRNVLSTPSINFPSIDTKQLNETCQQFPQLQHMKFPDIDNGKIGILLDTACVQLTHALEWICAAPNCPAGVRTELGWTITGELTHPKKRKTHLQVLPNFLCIALATPEIQPSTYAIKNY